MSRALEHLLRELDIEPVLVDIGASGDVPPIWRRIAAQSTYFGFDPDQRELCETVDERFARAVIVNKAVTAEEGRDELTFYLTKFPFCSSTLAPDLDALSDFAFAELFTVERTTCVPAISLSAVRERFGLPHVDWLKIDSQGTDLRLFQSLPDDLRHRVLALDIEPGLIDAYVGEDLFVDCHAALVREGFWLSNLDVQGAARIRRSTVEAISGPGARRADDPFLGAIRKSPAWCEARYFRTIASLEERDCTLREYVLLWAFALLDEQWGFALDVGMEYARRFGEDAVSRILLSEPRRHLRRSSRRQSLLPAAVRLVRRMASGPWHRRRVA